MENTINNIPRRSRLDWNNPAELAITKAMQDVEEMGADVKLTKAINLLKEAKDLVSDIVDAAFLHNHEIIKSALQESNKPIAKP